MADDEVVENEDEEAEDAEDEDAEEATEAEDEDQEVDDAGQVIPVPSEEVGGPGEGDEGFDKEKVEALVADASVADLLPLIASAGPNKLAAIKDAEEAGKERKGVLAAIEDREFELDELGDEDAEPLKVDPADVDELIPVILAGFWVRLGVGQGLPPHAAGRDAVVTFAPVKRSQGQDTLKESPYDFQDGSEIFTVRLRDTNELFQTTRDSFQAFAPEQSQLLAEVMAA